MNIQRLLSLILIICLLAAPLPAFAANGEAAAEDAAEPIRIGFIDTGISTKHIDASRVMPGRNYVFPEQDTEDRIGHGTATASLVLGAEDQSVVGVFPEAVCVPLVVVDAFASGVTQNGGVEALCRAIRDAAGEFGCRVINISLSTAEDSPALREAIAYAEEQGAVVVTTTGNDGEGGSTFYPAAYATVLAVGAFDGQGAARFSQSGADFLSDGVGLPAATNKGSADPAAVSGTSYACALLSGICAKVLAKYPALTPAQLRTALQGLAVDIAPYGFDARSGWGYISRNSVLPPRFLDVPESAWFFSYVDGLAQRGLMEGKAALFHPNEPSSRGEIVEILWKLAGSPAAGACPFTDIAAGSAYAQAAAWAYEHGVAAGMGDGRFAPESPVTREQLAALLRAYVIALGKEDLLDSSAELTAFLDAADISAWAKDYVSWIVGLGLIGGTASGYLLPRGETTRAQLAVIITQYCSKIEE